MNMKRKPLCAILLWLLVIVFPMIASAATDAAIAQEIHVTNTPIRGTIEIDKQGPVLTGFRALGPRRQHRPAPLGAIAGDALSGRAF